MLSQCSASIIRMGMDLCFILALSTFVCLFHFYSFSPEMSFCAAFTPRTRKLSGKPMTLDTGFSILYEVPEGCCLTHTSDRLLHHTKRANYQALVWKQALNAVQDLPPPAEHGWMCTDAFLTPVLMTKDPAPSGLVEVTLCKCKKSLCSRRDVACKKNKLPCTEACACMAGEDCQSPKL